MSRISLYNVDFHYDSPFQEIFHSLTLTISANWKSALIGRNGRGKTTLFRLLAGALKPVSGSVDVPFEVMYFPYSPSNPEEITHRVIKESIAPFSFWEQQMEYFLDKGDEEGLNKHAEYFELYNHYDGYIINELIEKEASRIGLDEDILNRPFATLSGGERTRALILSLFMRKDCFPLIDEPTNHLDLRGREQLAEYLASGKKGFIVASHDRHLLDSCADHIISINKNSIEVIQGNYSSWKYQSDIAEEFEQRRYDNIQREISELERAAKQRRNWSDKKEKEKDSAPDSGFIGHKSAKMMKRAIAIERRIESNIESKKALLKNKETGRSIRMKEPGKMPNRLISISDLTISFDGREILSGIYLNVFKGDRIAITGKNGCGKTTLLNAIDRTVPVTAGEVSVARSITTARAYQIPLWNEGSLKDHLSGAGLDMTAFRFVMSAFGMTGEIFDHPLETFSNGQLRKIDLCRTIVSAPQLLIWDEPLNYLDIASREQLEEFILAQNPTIVFVEHDRFFIDSVATDIFELG